MVIKLKVTTVLILAVFLVALFGGFLAMKGGDMVKNLAASAIQPVSAAEIYPMFLCPCCGQPLDKNNICCQEAQERIDYIDSLIKPGASKDAIILAYVKKYGASSFADKNQEKDLREKLAALAPQDRPVITLAPVVFDFGDVSQKKGIVYTFFNIKNEGKNDLVINKLDSSCGCTSASVVFEGKEGPRFAMAGHGIENPTDWQLAIPPGQNAQLKVYYDPSVHFDFRGPATREITVFSNDPIDFEKKIQVDLTQVD